MKNCKYCGEDGYFDKRGVQYIVCKNCFISIQKKKIVSKETRRKMSESLKRRVVSEETRKKISIAHKGKKLSEETRKKIGLAQKNKIVSEETREKMRRSRLGKKHNSESIEKIRNYMKENAAKYWLGKKRPEFSKKTRKKMSEAHIGKKASKEIKLKMSLNHNSPGMTGKVGFWKGKKLPDYIKQKISEANTGKKLSEETRKKIRIANVGKKYEEKTKEKHRKNMIKHIQETRGKLACCIGKNETEILNQIEYENKIKLLRQHHINGYFIDGYDIKNNVVYEVNEEYHFNNSGYTNKHNNRKNNIINHIKCKWIDINDIKLQVEK